MIRWIVVVGLFAISVVMSIGCRTSNRQGKNESQMGGVGGNISEGEAALTSEQLEEVQRTVRNGMDSINSCFAEEMERQKNQKLSGKVTVKILISTDKKASQVLIGEHTLNSPILHECIVQTIRSWEFPLLSSPAWFTYPFEFSPAY